MFSELQPQGSFQNNYCVNLANILNVGVHFECKSFPQSAMINWDKALLSPKISQKLARCFANPAPGLFFSCEGWGVREDIAQMQFFFIFSQPRSKAEATQVFFVAITTWILGEETSGEG
jgi:hypothetical protein